MIVGQPLWSPAQVWQARRLPYNVQALESQAFVDETHLDRDDRLA